MSLPRFTFVACWMCCAALAAALVEGSSPASAAEEAKRSAPAILVYEVDPESKRDGQPVDMKGLIAVLNRRINPGWFPRARIREISPERIEITVRNPDPANVEQIARRVTALGTLEFRVTANEHDHRSIIQRAKLLSERETKLLGEKTPGEEKPPTFAWWVPISEKRERDFPASHYVTRVVKQGDRNVTQLLVVNDRYHVTGAYLDRASPSNDERGRPAVAFSFNATGATRFGKLTSDNLPDPVQDVYRHLGIILDGRIYSAPRIQSAIYDRGQISGDFTQREVQDLVDILNAGALPARLKKVTDAKSGP